VDGKFVYRGFGDFILGVGHCLNTEVGERSSSRL
jgi:hypothetical protein